MSAAPHSPADLLPHAAPMILLERVLDWNGADWVAAEVDIGPHTPFLDRERGVPAHVGLEWMAQCCGLFAGLDARAGGGPVRVGYLLGTRRYRARRLWFGVGERLRVEARLLLRDGGMAVFDCTIGGDGGDEPVAAAQLTLYQPEA
ncbi:hypothetical protein GALL_80160 [mine drainage metagenome]|uniref:3-hydroxylacyl-ACP dehydratase n=1 Tax=mine drainage metagenome TaxID=410659 RepID=A0A1J5T1H4_9ZZZZ